MTSRAELEARIWRVSAPNRPAQKGKVNPGRPIASRLTNAEAHSMAELLRRDGVECLVNRV